MERRPVRGPRTCSSRPFIERFVAKRKDAMMISTRCAVIGMAMCAAAAVRLAAQQNQPPPQPKPDSPAITEQLDRLKKSVGPRWADAVHFWCEAPRANRPDDPVIQPAKIFDNVYAVSYTHLTLPTSDLV